MSHAAIQAQLSDYLEGDVSFAERGVIDAHLARCRLCAREFEELRRTVELLRSLPTPRPAAGLAAAVFRRLEQGEGRRSWIAQLGFHLADFGLTPAALPLSALAAVALVIGVVGLPDLPISTSSLWAGAEFSEKSDLVPKSPASSSAARALE